MENRKDPLYFIALMPPSDIRRKVEQLKKEIKLQFGIKHALKLPAHITVKIPFRIPESKEQILIKHLTNFCLDQDPMPIQLDGFGRFDKRVIFIQLVHPGKVNQMHEQLQELTSNLFTLKPHEIATRIHPHITIATRDLSRTQFPGVWAQFESREFSENFTICDLHLFKHNGKTWDIIRKFRFDQGT